MSNKRRVLFLCAENSCRSQMAEGFLRSIAPDKFDVFSAGSKATYLNANAVSVMAEIGIDISHHRSESVDEYIDRSFDYAITVCGSEEDDSCPIFPGRADKRLHWPFDDPAKASGARENILGVFRKVRDQIGEMVKSFVIEEASAKHDKNGDSHG
jgi:arsenate reductase